MKRFSQLVLLTLSIVFSIPQAFACEENTIEVFFQAGQWPNEVSWEIVGPDSSFYFYADASDQTTDSTLLELCVPDGCFELNLFDSFGDGWNGAVIGLLLNGQVIVDATFTSGSFESITFGINADCEDNEEPVFGCTDPQAVNYNPNATQDDGSCAYIEVENDLCADAQPLEEGTVLISNEGAYNNENIYGACWNSGGGEGEQTSIWFSFTTPEDPASIHIEASGDGSFSLTDTQFGLFEECGGEMIYCDGNSGEGLFSAFNFDCGTLAPSTEYLMVIDGWYGDEGTCFLTYEVNTCTPIEGCTDPNALNYNPDAAIDDGSCEYLDDCEGNVVEIATSTEIWASEISWMIYASDSTLVAEGSDFADNDIVFDILCLEDGCYTLQMFDSFGDGWNGGTINILSAGTDIVFETLEQGNFNAVSFSLGDVDCGEPQDDETGCTDQNAVNYDPAATIDDGSCEYPFECDLNNIGVVTATENWGFEIAWSILDADGNLIYEAGGFANNTATLDSLCLADGCYTLQLFDSFGDGWNGAIISVLTEDETIVLTTLEDGEFESVSFGVNAECGDNPIDVFGCTDQNAINFDPAATVDDGSCEYDFECTDNTMLLHFDIGEVPDSAYLQYGIGQQYNAYIATGSAGMGLQQFTVDVCIPDGCYSIFLDSWSDASWVGSSVIATLDGDTLFNLAPQEDMDVIELSFGINADCEENIFGCTDPQAENYNPEATIEDGSCTYPVECDENLVTLNLNTESWGEEVVWAVVDEDLNAVASGNGYESFNSYSIDLCLADGCYGLIMLDLFGDGWNGAVATLEMDGSIIAEGTLESGDEGSIVFGVNSVCGTNELVTGCTDDSAINYDPEAELNDGSCIFSMDGNPMYALTDFENQPVAAMLQPNPAIGPVSLKLEELDEQQPTTVEIHDMTGRLVFSANYGRDQTNLNEVIDISGFAAGIHLVTITNGKSREVIRLIKQN